MLPIELTVFSISPAVVSIFDNLLSICDVSSVILSFVSLISVDCSDNTLSVILSLSIAVFDLFIAFCKFCLLTPVPFKSNNCANLKCAEQADERCNNDLSCAAGRFCGEDGYCQDLRNSGEKCVESKECPPYNVCNRGRCTKIGEIGSGGVANDLDEKFNAIVCEHGIMNDSGECKKIIDEETNYCKYDKDKEKYYHTVIYDDNTSSKTECRTNILTGAPYPNWNLEKQNAFDNYKSAIAKYPKGNTDSIWEFKNNRIHGDKKEVKAALTAYLYPELANDGDDEAVCVRNFMQQYTLSSNKINISKIMILLFALFI